MIAIGDVMRKAYKQGWITTRDGNISLRHRGQTPFTLLPQRSKGNDRLRLLCVCQSFKASWLLMNKTSGNWNVLLLQVKTRLGVW